MEIGRIRGCTRVIGRSQGYYGLPLRDSVINDTVTGPDTPVMETAWLPSMEELQGLVAGRPIILRVIGRGHPPVMIWVGDDDEKIPDTGLYLVQKRQGDVWQPVGYMSGADMREFASPGPDGFYRPDIENYGFSLMTRFVPGERAS